MQYVHKQHNGVAQIPFGCNTYKTTSLLSEKRSKFFL